MAPTLPRHRVHARRRVPEWAAQGHEGLPCREGSSGTVRQPGAMATWEYSRQGRWILLTQRAPISWRVEEYVRGSRSRLEPRGPRLSRGICQTSCAGPWSRRRRGFEPRRYRCEVLASAQGSPVSTTVDRATPFRVSAGRALSASVSSRESSLRAVLSPRPARQEVLTAGAWIAGSQVGIRVP
jgi:hypothetical protein